MGRPKGKRGKRYNALPRRAKRARRGLKLNGKDSPEMKAMLRKTGLHHGDVLPHFVGRGRWRGMRDNAPEENGPVKVRKVRVQERWA